MSTLAKARLEHLCALCERLDWESPTLHRAPGPHSRPGGTIRCSVFWGNSRKTVGNCVVRRGQSGHDVGLLNTPQGIMRVRWSLATY